MWFRQLQLFQIDPSIQYTPEILIQKLEPFAFKSCLPSLPSSIGWVSPLDNDNAPLIHAANGYMMLCLQAEDKILPATVIRQALDEKIKQIEDSQARKVYKKEKLSLKDEMMMTLLPRAFSKLSRVYAYIDTYNHWLVIGNTNGKRVEQLTMLFKKTISEDIHPCQLKKLGPILTHWLSTQDYPSSFSIEKAAVLQDPGQQTRTIRCQQQDLFAGSIQSLLKDGCEVKELAFSWQDQINFILSNDFLLRSIQFHDELIAQTDEMNNETKEQQFDADFVIMTETLAVLLKDLLQQFEKAKDTVPKSIETLSIA
jgi:recombination associated protein RdgC